MHPHSNDTLVLPFSPFPRSRSTGLQERSLHFGRDDKWKTGNLTSSFTPLRGSILRLWRAPSLRGYSYRNITPIVPKHATYLPDENPSAPPYRHPERTKTLYVWKSPSQNKWGLSRRISCHTCETIHSPLIKGMTGDLNATSGHRPNKKRRRSRHLTLNLEP